ncbi:MAG TPA: hypothetical protein PKI20_13495 [Verrucomicrobiota bacterium]|nr:hypothetical protein [Verrucomicrobiota bacterium]HQL78712.1 hypothetical protein [Verrucomicrobiota bacterium]
MDQATSVQKIRALHSAYVLHSGLAIGLDMYRERVWFEWLRRGFTLEDLKLVIRYLRAGIRDGQRNRGALRFSNLIAQPDRFEEDLAEARAQARPRHADPARAAVLRASGRPGDPAGAPAKAAGQIAAKIVSDPVAAAKAYEEFKKFKASL